MQLQSTLKLTLTGSILSAPQLNGEARVTWHFSYVLCKYLGYERYKQGQNKVRGLVSFP